MRRLPMAGTMEKLHLSQRLVQVHRAFELILPAALIVLSASIQFSGARQRLLGLQPLWANGALIGHVSFLAAAGLVAQAVIQRGTALRSGGQLTLRLLTSTLILLVACIVVVLWKYLVWLIPDTWTTQGIFLEAKQPGSLVDLYSIHQL